MLHNDGQQDTEQLSKLIKVNLQVSDFTYEQLYVMLSQTQNILKLNVLFAEVMHSDSSDSERIKNIMYLKVLLKNEEV